MPAVHRLLGPRVVEGSRGYRPEVDRGVVPGRRIDASSCPPRGPLEIRGTVLIGHRIGTKVRQDVVASRTGTIEAVGEAAKDPLAVDTTTEGTTQDLVPDPIPRLRITERARGVSRLYIITTTTQVRGKLESRVRWLCRRAKSVVTLRRRATACGERHVLGIMESIP